MKKFCFLLLSLYVLVEAGHAGSAQRSESYNLDPKSANELAKIISLIVVNRIQEKTSHLQSNKIPVIPELPEEEQLPDLHVEFKADSPLNPLILGEMNFCDSIAKNLSTIKDDFTMGPEGPQVKALYRLDVGDLSVSGLHSHALRLLGSTTFTEFGTYEIALIGGYFGLELHLEVNIVHGNITLHSVVLDAGFESLTLNSDESVLNGEPINWDEVNSQIKPIFDAAWAGLKETLEGLLPAVFNGLLKDCTISDLLNGRFECIGLGKNKPIKLLEENLLNILNVQVYDIEQCQNPKTIPPIEATTTDNGVPEETTTEENNQSTTDNGTPGPGETTTEGNNQSTPDNGTPGPEEPTTEGSNESTTSEDLTTEIEGQPLPTTSEKPDDDGSGSESIFMNFYFIFLSLSVLYNL